MAECGRQIVWKDSIVNRAIAANIIGRGCFVCEMP